MVYGPIVPTSYRHAALPSFSLSLHASALLLRHFVSLRSSTQLRWFSLSLPATRSRFPARPAFSRRSSLSVSRNPPPFSSPPARLSCGQCKGGESGPRVEQRELPTERKLTVNEERAIPETRDQDGDERSTHTWPIAHG